MLPLHGVLGTIPLQLIVKSNLILSTRNPRCYSATAAESLLEIKIETITGMSGQALSEPRRHIWTHTCYTGGHRVTAIYWSREL